MLRPGRDAPHRIRGNLDLSDTVNCPFPNFGVGRVATRDGHDWDYYYPYQSKNPKDSGSQPMLLCFRSPGHNSFLGNIPIRIDVQALAGA